MNKKVRLSGRINALPGARAILIVLAMLFGGFANAQTGGQTGFEDGTTDGWAGASGTESVALNAAAANVRTGSYSLALTTTSTSTNKYFYAYTPYGASATGTYVHFIYWAKATDAATTSDASMRYTTTAPPSAAGSTVNGSATALNTTSWTRLSLSAGNSSGRYYYAAPRRTSGNATTFFMDDMVMYVNGNVNDDLTKPNTPTALSAAPAGSNVNLTWTSAVDAGTGATGVQNTIVLRTTNLAAAAPGFNDQATYSTAGGVTGPNTVGDWTIISTTTSGTATTYTDAGLATGIYKYAVVLRDGAYNYSIAAVSPNVTIGTPSPTVSTSIVGFSGLFGNVVAGTNSAEQTYRVAGAALTSNIVITAPADFQVSLTSGSGFGSSLTLTPASGTVAATTIYVRYSPAAATGASGSLAIINTSTGATTQNVTVSGNALAVEPTTAGSISFSTVSSTSIVVNLPTVGNGTNRIIVVHQGSAVTFVPTDGVAIAGVSSIFTAATDQGSGNKVVYDGTGSGSNVVTVTGLTQGTAYYFAVYEYNVGTGTSQNYLLSPVATANATTGTPAIVLNTTGFTAAFGNVAVGSSSAEQTYTVSGTALATDITVTAPTGFQVSLTSGTGFASSLTVTQSGGVVPATTIYVRYSPAAATGATGSLTVTNASTGAVTRTVTVNGNALAAEPTTAGSIAFGTISNTSIVVNLPTVGDGSRRIIVVHQGSAVTYAPTDAAAVTGVNASFTVATDQGAGNKIVYDGTGSGAGVVTVTGLTQGTAYYFTVYEYNTGTGTSQNYLLSPVATANATTTAPAIVVTTTGFSGAFGNVVTGTSSAEQTYTVSGTGLTTDITVTAPAGFEVSATTGTGFGTSVTLTQTAGAVAATTIYVRYSPTGATGATGSLSISNASTGATTQNVMVSGNALAIEPTVAGTITTGNITSTSIELNLPTVGDGIKRIIVASDGAAVTFLPADANTMTGVNSDYSVATDQGSGNKVVYDGAGSGNSVVTVTGLTASDTYYFAVYEYNEGTGTSQNYLTSTAATTSLSTSPLPVVLTAFSARWAAGHTATVDWTTATESNMSRYVIERSFDGTIFEDAGAETPRGTAATYHWTDDLESAASRYYRLRMEEWDGSKSYSAVQKLSGSAGSTGGITAGPVPFAARLDVHVQCTTGGAGEIMMMDVSGRIVRDQAITLEKGDNLISWTGMDAFATGTYYLRIRAGGMLQTLRIIK